MESQRVWNSIARFYASVYDDTCKQVENLANIKRSINGDLTLSEDDLLSVIHLTLSNVAAELEEGANRRWLQVDDSKPWGPPVVRYVVEDSEGICEDPDEQIDPIFAWVEDLTEDGMLKGNAKERLPSYSILEWIMENKPNP